MAEITVFIISPDNDHRAMLQVQVDGTAVARTLESSAAPPVALSDPILRRIEGLHPDVVLVDIPANSSATALHGIELLHTELPKTAIFAAGDLSQPQVIVSAMRAGAREFIERPTTTSHLLDAFVRLTSSRRKLHAVDKQGKIFTFINAKGGSGATTLAVNTALSLATTSTSVALVDLAPLGHIGLHLNVRPTFTVADAIRNLHRLDGSLLEGYMTRHDSGVHLLAGAKQPFEELPSPADFARLFDLLVNHYNYVVVDLSTRLDAVGRVLCDVSDQVLIVAQSDVASLWSAARVQEFLSTSADTERIRLVLNRFKKISGFSESDAEEATRTKLLAKIPNHYPTVSGAIDRGIPVVQQNHSELARSLADFTAALTSNQERSKRKSWSIFKTA
jgi:pilus assembly protein CpaE